jgi:hypothetical protein
MPSLGLNSHKKQVSHTTNLHYYIYEEKEIIYRTSLITKEKLDTITSKSLNGSISSYKKKREIRIVLKKK